MNRGTHYFSIATAAAVAGCSVIAACAPAAGVNQTGSSVATSPSYVYNESGVTSTSIDVTHENRLSTGTVHVPVAAAWVKALEAYTSLGIPLTTSVEAQHKLGNEGMNTNRSISGKSLSDYLVCGIGPRGNNADVYGVHLSAVTQLTPVSDSSTRIATMVQAQSAPGYGAASVECSSTGLLEQRISALIGKQ